MLNRALELADRLSEPAQVRLDRAMIEALVGALSATGGIRSWRVLMALPVIAAEFQGSIRRRVLALFGAAC